MSTRRHFLIDGAAGEMMAAHDEHLRTVSKLLDRAITQCPDLGIHTLRQRMDDGTMLTAMTRHGFNETFIDIPSSQLGGEELTKKEPWRLSFDTKQMFICMREELKIRRWSELNGTADSVHSDGLILMGMESGDATYGVVREGYGTREKSTLDIFDKRWNLVKRCEPPIDNTPVYPQDIGSLAYFNGLYYLGSHYANALRSAWHNIFIYDEGGRKKLTIDIPAPAGGQTLGAICAGPEGVWVQTKASTSTSSPVTLTLYDSKISQQKTSVTYKSDSVSFLARGGIKTKLDDGSISFGPGVIACITNNYNSARSTNYQFLQIRDADTGQIISSIDLTANRFTYYKRLALCFDGDVLYLGLIDTTNHNFNNTDNETFKIYRIDPPYSSLGAMFDTGLKHTYGRTDGAEQMFWADGIFICSAFDINEVEE